MLDLVICATFGYLARCFCAAQAVDERDYTFLNVGGIIIFRNEGIYEKRTLGWDMVYIDKVV